MPRLKEAIAQITDTKRGHEHSMHPGIKAIFEALGHKSENIKTGVRSEGSGGIPDLHILASTGVGRGGKALMGTWLVCVAKDERGAFSTFRKREKIFAEKAKYIALETEFFVMIDPAVMVIRPVRMRSQAVFDEKEDVVIRWAEVSEWSDERILEKMALLQVENSGPNGQLKVFRSGDTSSIAVVKLSQNDPSAPAYVQKRYQYARKDFLDVIRNSAQMLRTACIDALNGAKPEIEAIERKIEAFSARYGGISEFSVDPFVLSAKGVCYENAKQHDLDAEAIREAIYTNPPIGKLAAAWLPEFRKRVGKVAYNKKDFTPELFATETGNLILARVLLLRFFEEHGFFEEKRYSCNGGAEAFEKMRGYFGFSYAKLLQYAYEKAGTVHYSAFDEMEPDWVFGSNSEHLSMSIELCLMYLSRFDFTTVSGGILTDIHDRLMSGGRRTGEYRTPPSIARYIVDRMKIAEGRSVFDPACGSGTFIIEAFKKEAGEAIASGVGGYAAAKRALENIAANDLSPFSAMLTRIGLLWHLMPLEKDLQTEGFPRIRVCEKRNALIPASLAEGYSLCSEIDSGRYDAVIGNPPCIRPEGSGQELPRPARAYYEGDIPADQNLFGLFIYRALKSWCKPDGEGALGFVVPQSLCDHSANGPLRELFRIGGRWRIREIVNMEAISERVFGAAVNLIVFIADTKPAAKEDRVVVRAATAACVSPCGEADLDKATEADLAYEDIWSSDGRILTKLTDGRFNT